MKKPFLMYLLLSTAFLFTACSVQIPFLPNRATEPPETERVSDLPTTEPETPPSEPAPQAEPLVLSINGSALDVQWVENETVAALLAHVQNENIVVHTTIYGGFEQVGSPQHFPRNDARITTEPGDIVLYSGDQLVLFLGSNSWSYTKLGQINGLSPEELSALLGADSAVVEIKPR
ncbi:MAG: cyclophilin-like fold protein [Candidatus Onthomonas sp.]|nr:cyclophilin-like fold protein [Candidatus Onthomonas sp.]